MSSRQLDSQAKTSCPSTCPLRVLDWGAALGWAPTWLQPLLTILCAQSKQPWPLPTRTCLQSPGWTWEVGEVFAASFPLAICGDSGWTYFCHHVLLTCHPHGHCSHPLSPSTSKDLLGLTDLRFGSGGMFEGTSCWVTMLWHLPACMSNLDVYSSVSLLTADVISWVLEPLNYNQPELGYLCQSVCTKPWRTQLFYPGNTIRVLMDFLHHHHLPQMTKWQHTKGK